MAKNKLSKLSQTHGKVESFEPTTLEQVWGGSNPVSIYGTLNEADYINELNEMSKSELQTHAIAHGEIPIDNVSLLRRKLLRRFNDTILPYVKPISKAKIPSKITPEVEKILAEGR